MRQRFRELAGDLVETRDQNGVDVLADEVALVMEGVYASVQALVGRDGPARRARSLVERLIDEHQAA